MTREQDDDKMEGGLASGKADVSTTTTTPVKKKRRLVTKVNCLALVFFLLVLGIVAGGIKVGLDSKFEQKEAMKTMKEVGNLHTKYLERQREMTEVMSEIYYTVNVNTSTSQLESYEAYIRDEYEGMYADIDDFDFHRTKSEGLKDVNREFKRYEEALRSIWDVAFLEMFDAHDPTLPYNTWLITASFFLNSPQGEAKRLRVRESYDEVMDKIVDNQSSSNDSRCSFTFLAYALLFVIVVVFCFLFITYAEDDQRGPCCFSRAVEQSDACTQQDELQRE